MTERPHGCESTGPIGVVGARPAGKPGFSLIDLLVSIGVMTILIAVLLPSLGAAQEQARRVKCSSNVRQIGLALQMYCFQNADQLPSSIFEERSSNDRGAAQDMIFVRVSGHERASTGVSWDGLGFLFDSDYLNHPGVFYCPSHNGNHSQSLYVDAWRSDVATEIATNYHYRVPEESRYFSELQGASTLAADGMRRRSDYNHEIGNNFLKADLSVGWFRDSEQVLTSNLVDDTAPPSQADASVESCWQILDAVSPSGLLRPDFTRPTQNLPAQGSVINAVVVR